MQSTPNTAAPPPVRPKVGRPPLELVIPSSPPSPPREWELPFNWKPRVAAFTLALVIAAVLVFSRAVTVSTPEMVTEQTPRAVAALKQTSGSLPIVGALTPIQPAEQSVTYTDQNQKPVIDNAARQRLLSILSKD